MSSIFTRIINGEIPGRFVWRDSECVAFMDIQPISRGHLLVVPRQETDRWHDLPPPDGRPSLCRGAQDRRRPRSAFRTQPCRPDDCGF